MGLSASLNTAVQGLSAAQRGMDVTGQNVANANTAGYSRQEITLRAVGATATATLTSGNRAFFGGVEIAGVARVRDAFLESTTNAANSRMSALTAQTSALSGAENLVSEPSDTGLVNAMNDFFNSWHDLGANTTDSGAAATTLQRGKAVASQIQSIATGIDNQWQTAHGTLSDVVTQVNATAKSVADLNDQILQGSTTGRPVSELQDQRDTLVRKLGTLVGATQTIDANGMANVSVNGINLVSGIAAQQFSLIGGVDIPTSAGNPPTITWNGTTVPVASGQAAGLLSVLGTDLPNMSSKMDGVANAIKDAVNSFSSSGYTTAGAAAGNFFSGTGAHDLAVVPTSGDQLAVAATAGTVDGSIAQSIGDLTDDTKAKAALGGTTDGPLAQYRSLSTGLGVQVQSLTQASSVQKSVVQTAQNASDADSGVNLDEEMSNMLLWQRSYQASARVISTVDSMMDTLINGTR